MGCGAKAVGEPLARPQHELPAYGRALIVSVTGALTLLLFLVATIMTLVDRPPGPSETSPIIFVLETAAWRLKWVGFPLAIASVWLSWRLYNSVRKQPALFIGTRAARNGFAASILFALLLTTFVGISVPKRLRARQQGIEASYRAQLYTHNRALLEYRARFGTFPTDISDLRNLPDSDGSIADLVNQSNLSSYKPWTELAASQPATVKSSRLRGVAIQPAALASSGDDSRGEGVPFTNYELRLPGEDKILGTDDDWLMRDGLVVPVSAIDSPSSALSSVPSAR